MTVSIENFIKVIYKQSKLTGADNRLSTIARLLNITNAAATDMARKLAKKDVVNYIKYKPLTLTENGFNMALNIIRKHRLWESFLYKTLNLSLHEIHREAEQLEHQTSEFLAEKIENYLA
jgi:DtxR family Mn-dependent transcriptional regulator